MGTKKITGVLVYIFPNVTNENYKVLYACKFFETEYFLQFELQKYFRKMLQLNSVRCVIG